MSVTVAAIYENGILRPQQPLDLAEGAQVQVTISSATRHASSATRHADWSDETEIRRHTLIDKDIAGTITAEEADELAYLDRLANEHFDRIAPLPLDGARQLHDRLLKQRASGPAATSSTAIRRAP